MQLSTRKQRTLKDREQLILNIAAELLESDGYLGLNMDRIAEATEYSKGTIYQHFTCKEEIVCALSARTMQTQLEMLERVHNFSASPREKMVAALAAHQILARLYTRAFNNLLIIKNTSIRGKIPEANLKQLRNYENRCFEAICNIVEEAIQAGDLQLQIPVPEMVFGFWAIAFGSSMLQIMDYPLAQMNIHNPDETIRLPCRYALDGFGWKPLSSEWDYSSTYRRIHEELFPEEIEQLKMLHIKLTGT